MNTSSADGLTHWPIPENFDIEAYESYAQNTLFTGLTISLLLTIAALLYYRKPLAQFARKIPLHAAFAIFIIYGDIGYHHLRRLIYTLLPDPTFTTMPYYSVFSMSGIFYILFALTMLSFARKNTPNPSSTQWTEWFICIYPTICLFTLLFLGQSSPISNLYGFIDAIYIRAEQCFHMPCL